MKPKIEKVDHSPMSGTEKFILSAYYPTSDTLSQSQFFSEAGVMLSKNTCTTGYWKIKKLK